MAHEISIVGELNLDLLLYGLPQQLPMERELLASGFEMTLGSSSAILAHNLARLGSTVGFLTCVGQDPLGKIALEYVRDSAIDLSVVHPPRHVQTGVTFILPHGKERHILTYPGAMLELSYENLDWSFLKSARHFHLSSLYLQRGLLPDAARVFRELKAAGLTTSLDTNDDPEDRWEGLDEIFPHLDIFLPNLREACRITQTSDGEQAMEALARKVPVVVVKMGAEGARLRKGSWQISGPAQNVAVIDTVGAGDSFNAGFLNKYVQGADLEECLRFGNRTAALSTTAAGGVEAFRDPLRLKQWLETNP
ncbi:MAG TPA: sugar kinase [Armatimonadota bacterium]